jgi:hypothetical protein
MDKLTPNLQPGAPESNGNTPKTPILRVEHTFSASKHNPNDITATQNKSSEQDEDNKS